MYMYFHAPGNQYSFATGIQDFDNKKAMMFPDATIPTEYVADGTYGAQRLYNEFASMTEVNDDGYGLGNISNGSAGFVGTVKFFRYYDRVLTEEELVRNRNADAVRYFGKLAVTNVVVSINGAVTAYKVEGSYTFDASGETVGGKEVVGYYTEEFVNGDWTNKKWNNGTEYTYAEATANGKTIRLTWSGPRPGMMIIVK